jgi:hypothetical protein
MWRLFAVSMLAAIVGCTDLDRVVYEQGQYNSQRCSVYGMPGSPAYSACINQGANYRPAGTLGTPASAQGQSCTGSSRTVQTGDAMNSTTTTTSNYTCR